MSSLEVLESFDNQPQKLTPVDPQTTQVPHSTTMSASITNLYPISALPGITVNAPVAKPPADYVVPYTYPNDKVGWQHVGDGKSKNRRRHRHRRATHDVVDAIHPTLQRLQECMDQEFSSQKQTQYKRKFAPIMTEVIGKNRNVDPYLMEAIDTGSWRSIRKFDTTLVDALLHRSLELDNKAA
jgi:hypothetical protein